MVIEPHHAQDTRVCPECEVRTSSRLCAHDGLPTLPEAQLHGSPRGLEGLIVADRYRLDAPLARGAMGAIFRAHMCETNQEVAIKLLRPELVHDRRAVRRFYREARIARGLVGPHFARVHDFGFDEGAGAPFIVMELLAGPTVGTLAPLAPRRAAMLLSQVAQAIDCAHAAGIVHRDLKAANIIVTRDEAGAELIKVTDFGVAKDLAAGDDTLTRSGEPVGTPTSMAPEQIDGGEVDARTDLYALGCLIHRLLTNERVFGAADLGILMQQHLAEAPPRLPTTLPGGEALPRPLAVLRDALLAKRPCDRPTSAAAVAEVLARVAANDDAGALQTLEGLGVRDRDDVDGDTWEPGSSVAIAAAPTARKPSRVRVLGWAALAIGAVAAIGAGLATSSGTTTERRPTRSSTNGLAPVVGSTVTHPASPSTDHVAEAPVANVPEAATPMPIAAIEVRLASRPTAGVYRDGERVGQTPYLLAMSPTAPPLALELRRAGFARRQVTLTPSTPQPPVVVLEALPAAREEPPWRPRPF